MSETENSFTRIGFFGSGKIFTFIFPIGFGSPNFRLIEIVASDAAAIVDGDLMCSENVV